MKTSQGSATWSKEAIYNLLRNRVYLGELRYGRDGRYVNAAAHDPLVDLATWQAAQHPNGRRLTPPRSEESEWLLTGLLRCGACRYAMQGTTTSRGRRIYRCTRRHSGGVCPAPARISAEVAETAAVDAFWALTADLEAGATQDVTGELAGLEQAFERADLALRQWTSAAVQEAIGDLPEYVAGLRERRRTRDEAADEVGRARAAAKSTAALPPVATLRDAWERSATHNRRDLLGLRFECLALTRERQLIVYPVGAGPSDLPRRGFRRVPELRPFPDPPDEARVLAL